MKVFGNVYSDIGERTVNEDAVLYSVVRIRKKKLVVAIVCDGIGGLSEGDLAAGYICRRLNEAIYSRIIPALLNRRSMRFIEKRLKDVLYSISKELREYADKKKIRLGSTLSCLLLFGRRYLILNVGDSRVYMIKDKKAPGMMTVSDINPDGSICRCIGSFPFYEPFSVRGYVFLRTGFLVCSDGFYKRMDKEISILCPSGITDECSI